MYEAAQKQMDVCREQVTDVDRKSGAKVWHFNDGKGRGDRWYFGHGRTLYHSTFALRCDEREFDDLYSKHCVITFKECQ